MFIYTTFKIMSYAMCTQSNNSGALVHLVFNYLENCTLMFE